jgi:predicted phosphodiesterase
VLSRRRSSAGSLALLRLFDSSSDMRIITYSDLHLEFGSGWTLPSEADGDLMILAGDIVMLRDYDPLDRLLQKWKKPVLYVTGNHEYYTRRPMNEEDDRFKAWLKGNHPHVKLLLDEEISIDGVNFFGGTMWTDFNGSDLRAMETARSQMNDFRLIHNPDQTLFSPADAVELHKNFAAKLLNWFGKDLRGPRVVVSHNAPVINPNSKYKLSSLAPAFNSLDMVEIIAKHQPALWVYGHTHECDDQTIGRARVISNQLGYPHNSGGFECTDFDEAGLSVEVGG